MSSIGSIMRLQVQAASLKVGTSPRRYDPAPLRDVSAVRLTSRGVLGLADDGRPIIDVHHGDHPASKNRGDNGLSIGFTAHYRSMRDHFGQHLADGIAGENILVETDRSIEPDELLGGLLILGQDGVKLPLQSVIVAAPCVEFARYALCWPDEARPDRRVTAALRFLDGGVRGYYASYAGPEAIVAVGDRVLLA